MQTADAQADQWLHKAVLEAPNDAGVLAALGYEEQKRGRIQQAREYYLHALEIDPLSNEAALNLGVIEAQAGNADRAIKLWQGPFDRIPGRSEVGMNLALLLLLHRQNGKSAHHHRAGTEVQPRSDVRQEFAAPTECRSSHLRDALELAKIGGLRV